MKIIEQKELRKILSRPVRCDLTYPTFLRRYQDDTDGSRDVEHQLMVSQGPDGDMYITVGEARLIRFRTWNGGGRSLHVHNALRILAEAIKMDEEINSDKIS